jgi:hypothetical protein
VEYIVTVPLEWEANCRSSDIIYKDSKNKQTKLMGNIFTRPTGTAGCSGNTAIATNTDAADNNKNVQVNESASSSVVNSSPKDSVITPSPSSTINTSNTKLERTEDKASLPSAVNTAEIKLAFAMKQSKEAAAAAAMEVLTGPRLRLLPHQHTLFCERKVGR